MHVSQAMAIVVGVASAMVVEAAAMKAVVFKVAQVTVAVRDTLSTACCYSYS